MVDLIRFQAKAILKHDDHSGLADMIEFQALLDTVEDLVSTLEEEFPLHGTLLRAQLEDEVPADDGTAMYPFLASRKILAQAWAALRPNTSPSKENCWPAGWPPGAGAGRFSTGVQPLDTGMAPGIGADAAHVVVRGGRDRNRLLAPVEAERTRIGVDGRESVGQEVARSGFSRAIGETSSITGLPPCACITRKFSRATTSRGASSARGSMSFIYLWPCSSSSTAPALAMETSTLRAPSSCSLRA